MIEDGFEISASHLNIMIRQCTLASRLDLAMDYFLDMYDRGLIPGLHSTDELITVSTRLGRAFKRSLFVVMTPMIR